MHNRISVANISKHEGKEVVLAGWVDARRDHGKLIFLDLRDNSGVAQLVVAPKNEKAHKGAHDVRDEWVLRVRGTVQKRPDNMVNPDLPTGAFEVPIEDLTVLSKAKTLPFPIDTDGYDISEELRLKYRYLDLRRARLAEFLRTKDRYKAQTMRFLRERGFLHVDTPILTKATPEGARDFLVPSRQHPGTFYALPQSPQQYKQLLMVAGVEKYFQFARAFRDEDLRQDRLLELEQLDIEMAFVDEEDVLKLVEELVIFVSEEVLGKNIQEKPFPRLTFAASIKEHKTDRPDLRKDPKDPNLLAYAWITDFPMFEEKDDGGLGAMHHPFTALQEGDKEKLDSKNRADILSIRAQQYDLALNGFEVFGGSIRTHQSEILTKVFKVLGHSEADVQEKFGHLLEAFSYGIPPHGGIAASERWLMAMLGERSIREVVPFPTTGTGHTAVMDAPSTVTKEQLQELGIEIKEPEKDNEKN